MFALHADNMSEPHVLCHMLCRQIAEASLKSWMTPRLHQVLGARPQSSPPQLPLALVMPSLCNLCVTHFKHGHQADRLLSVSPLAERWAWLPDFCSTLPQHSRRAGECIMGKHVYCVHHCQPDCSSSDPQEAHAILRPGLLGRFLFLFVMT